MTYIHGGKRIIAFVMAMAAIVALLISGQGAFAAERYQVMMKGDKDNYVLRLQKELYDRGYLKVEPTGYYGDATVDAVTRYQSRRNMTADGIAGIATQKAIYGKNYEPIPSTRVVTGPSGDDGDSAGTGSSENSSTRRYLVMMYGDKDSYVKKMQQKLYDLGILKTKPTGYFGEATLKAVITFQEKNDLEADGIAGVATQKALYGKSYEAIPSSRSINNSLTTGEGDDEFESLRSGDAGVLIKPIQEKLRALGYFPSETKATNNFGALTEACVRAFQERNDLTVDGVVGKKTYALMFSGNAKKATKEVTLSSGSSTGGSSTSQSRSDEAVDTGSASDNAIIEEVIKYAADLIGTPYKYGGKGPNSFDCSGFTSYVLKHVGVNASSSSKAQGNNDDWKKITYDNLRRGDLLIFTNTRLSAIGHVGIYLGDGRFIHCSSGSAMSVTISHLADRYMDRFLWGRRWISEADPDVLDSMETTSNEEADTPEVKVTDEADEAGVEIYDDVPNEDDEQDVAID